jgi:hypothetical protein
VGLTTGDSIGDSIEIETSYNIRNLSETHLEQMSVDTMSADVFLWPDMFLGYVLSFLKQS